MQRLVRFVLAAALITAPLSVRAADLVVWWEKGFYPQEDEAVAEIIAAFEQGSGKQVELVQPAPAELFDNAQGALEAGQPPDFLFGTVGARWIPQWAHDDQLLELGAALGPALYLFDTDAVEGSKLLNGSTNQRGLYALPMARASNHLHVWVSLLERAGFSLTDIPNEWEAFWTFWCDKVQPTVREKLAQDEIWAVGLPMSVAATDTADQVVQFQMAYGSPWLDARGQPQVDNPKIREGMVKALAAYAAIWRKSCAPPGSTDWTNIDNNKAFLGLTVIMTANPSLSVPSAVRNARPNDYCGNVAIIDWPNDATGQLFVIQGFLQRAVVFKAERNRVLAGDFVRFLAEGRLDRPLADLRG